MRSLNPMSFIQPAAGRGCCLVGDGGATQTWAAIGERGPLIPLISAHNGNGSVRAGRGAEAEREFKLADPLLNQEIIWGYRDY